MSTPQHPYQPEGPVAPQHTDQEGFTGSGNPQQPQANATPAVSPFVAALKAQFTTLTSNLKSNNHLSQQEATALPLYWVVNFSAASILAGLFGATLLHSVAKFIMDLGSYFFYSYSTGSAPLSFLQLFTTFIVVAIATFATLCLRTAGMLLTLNSGNQKYSFSYAANLYGESNVVLLPALAFLWIFSYLPIFDMLQIFMVLVLLLFAVCSLFLNLQVYVGMNRATQFQVSPILRYVLTTAGALVSSWVVWYISFQIIKNAFS